MEMIWQTWTRCCFWNFSQQSRDKLCYQISRNTLAIKSSSVDPEQGSSSDDVQPSLNLFDHSLHRNRFRHSSPKASRNFWKVIVKVLTNFTSNLTQIRWSSFEFITKSPCRENLFYTKIRYRANNVLSTHSAVLRNNHNKQWYQPNWSSTIR